MNFLALSLIISVLFLCLSTYHIYNKVKDLFTYIDHICNKIKDLEDSIYGIRSTSIVSLEENIQNLYNRMQDLKKEVGVQ